MHSPRLLLLVALAAPVQAAQISIVDETRFVRVTASASDAFGNPPVVVTDQVDAPDTGPFTASPTAQSSSPDAASVASGSQTSTLGASSITVTGSATGNGGSSDLNGGASHSSDALSSFEVTFDISTPTDYTLAGNVSYTDNANPTVRFESAAGDVLFDFFNPGLGANTPIQLSGTLAPGRYTLAATAEGGASGNAWWFFQDNSWVDLSFDVTPLPMGARDCVPPAPNSSGVVASVAAEGSNLVAQEDLTLTVSGVVPSQFGLFFYGAPAATPAPFGGGLLCAAAPLYRLSSPIQADANGMAAFPVDFAAFPVAGGSGAFVPGTTWAFQFWFRDPGESSGFSTSDSYVVSLF